jgi:tRNA pseudouridine38/39 synthase
MQQAASHFVGEHDFRNFCKVDAQHVSNFRRTILDFRITPVMEGCALAGGLQLFALHVRGTAFLWHQVAHPLLAMENPELAKHAQRLAS